MATSAQLLSDIQKKTQEQFQNNEAAFAAVQSGANAAAEKSKQAAQIFKDSAEAQAIIARETLLAQQKVEQAQRTAALAAGYDPATGSGELLDRIKRINQKGTQLIDLNQKLKEEQSVKFLDDPLKWLSVNFVSDTEDQVVAAAQELQTESEVLNNLNSVVQTTARTVQATAQTVTAAKIEATAKVAATDAQVRAIQAEQDGIRYGVEAIKARADMSLADLNALYNLRSATMAEQGYQLELAREARAREQFNMQQEMLKLQREEMKTEQQMDGYLMETLNFGHKMLGLPDMTAMDAKLMVQLLKKGGSEELNALYQMGKSYRMNPKNPMIGTDPASAYTNLVKLQGQYTEAQRPVVEALNDIKNTLPPQYFDPKTGKFDPTEYNKRVQQTIAGWQSNIKPGTDNPFDVGDIAPYLELSPELKATPFGQKVLVPAITAKQQLNSPAQLISLAIESATRGDITLDQAVSGVTNTYRVANNLNLEQRGFFRFGIVPPGAGLSYNARIAFGTTVDMTDPVAVGRHMSIELAKKRGGLFNPGAPMRAAAEDYSKFKGLK